MLINNVFKMFSLNITKDPIKRSYRQLFSKFREYTMMPETTFNNNLFVADKFASRIDGDVVECGVWRGGMIASLAATLGKNRTYYLFDSFEGLPEATAKDGDAALVWQKSTDAPTYYDNCRAEVDYSIKAMSLTGCKYEIIKGWFDQTLPAFNSTKKIALLRLDGDWYDSIKSCLVNLYPHVVKNGLIIIDDYYTWDGCSRAVHDYLSEIKSSSRIHTWNDVTYILKND